MSGQGVSIFEVAKYVLESKGKMTTMKLQKLCYYVHAWFLAENSKPMFDEKFQAWVNGPVCYTLYEAHRQKYSIDAAELPYGDSSALSTKQKSFIDEVMGAYAPLSAAQLSLLTHSEDPWLEARKGSPESSPSNEVSMRAAGPMCLRSSAECAGS